MSYSEPYFTQGHKLRELVAQIKKCDSRDVAMKVCIIGGGASGLVSLRRVLQNPTLTATLFEQNDDIGGLWYYNGVKSLKPTEDPENVTTMYDDLTCNVPYPLVEFLDFPHPRGQYSHPTQQQLHQYLQNYTSHFNMSPHIQLNSSVINIRPQREESTSSKDGTPCRWLVQSRHLLKKEVRSETFDAVIIATGHHTYPHPATLELPGLNSFQGKLIHSKYFKNGADFLDQNVVLIGIGASAGDIALILANFAKSVTICHRFPFGIKFGLLPEKCQETTNVKSVREKGVVTEKNEFVPCDAIIFCTGFELKYPFLDDSSGIEIVKNRYIRNLYKKTVFTKRPSLFFINLCYRAPEFIIAEIQARFIVSILGGKVKLPSFSEMENEVKAEEEERIGKGIPVTSWFLVGDFGLGSVSYFLIVAENIGIRGEYRHGALIEYLWGLVVKRVFGKLAVYKEDHLEMLEENKAWILTLQGGQGELPERLILRRGWETSGGKMGEGGSPGKNEMLCVTVK